MEKDHAASSPVPHAQPLISAIATFLAGQDPASVSLIRAALDREIDAAGPRAVAGLTRRLIDEAGTWDYYPPDPLARRIHHVIAETLLAPGSAFEGVDEVAAVAGRPLVVFGNHLSYADANLLEILLHRFGAPLVADRLTAIAGPKVYVSRTRRFSSLCFGTVRTPQNSGVASDEAVMSAREIARAAQHSIEVACERVRSGDALLIYAEGTRSRSTGMQPLLMGAARYLEVPGSCVLPIGITGTEDMFPVGEGVFRAVPVVARAGRPIDVGALREAANGDRRLMVDAIGVAVAEVLPESYRGVYGDDAPERLQARRVLERVR
jgi:1-acyl-sn-glycerol-3-phosphate acyltransferase